MVHWSSQNNNILPCLIVTPFTPIVSGGIFKLGLENFPFLGGVFFKTETQLFWANLPSDRAK